MLYSLTNYIKSKLINQFIKGKRERYMYLSHSLLDHFLGNDFFLHRVYSGSHNLRHINRSLIHTLLFIYDLQYPHALYHPPKDHILMVQECQRGTGSHIELGLIGMLVTLLLAHADQPDLGVLDMERFICEFTSLVYWAILFYLNKWLTIVYDYYLSHSW